MDFTPLIQAVISLAAVIITGYLVPMIKSRTTAQQRQDINAWVSIAVSAMEQIYNQGGQGDKKKQAVREFLRAKGIAYDEATLDAMIEAAVYQLKNGFIIENSLLLEEQL